METVRLLMCRPDHFDVTYAINAWMDPDVPVDLAKAIRQWEALVDTYESLGYDVSFVQPVAGLPDMVFAANSATVIDGKVLVARMKAPERRPEQDHYTKWFEANGFEPVVGATHTNEGEGDLVYMGDRILAGTGFRTTVEAHREVAGFFDLPVVTLDLVDPRFYHLDTALFRLDQSNVAWYPPAFSPESADLIRRLYPASIEASEADAMAFGLNSISDGTNIVIPREAESLVTRLSAAGYTPVPVDLSEFLKSGGSAKCCTLELRGR